MKYSKTVEGFFEAHNNYKEELELLRQLLLATDFEEGLKWGAPAYMIDGKNVIGLSAFKSYVGLWFHQGVFLADKEKRLQNAQETTKAMRQWRFKTLEEIEEDKELITQYLEEAIANHRAGKVMKIDRSKKDKPVEIPAELDLAMKGSKDLENSFSKLSKAAQREYCQYIASAKQAATKQRRIEKISPMILAGKGLNDAYKR